MKKAYYNGNIVTMTDSVAEVVVTSFDKIIFVGSLDEVKNRYNDLHYIDLKGGALFPAFFDGHSHLSGYANSLLQCSCDGCNSFDKIVNVINNFIQSSGIKRGEWIQVNDYDNNILPDKIHISREFLDENFNDYCVVIKHKSGHSGVFNSLAMSNLDVTANQSGFYDEEQFFTILKAIPMPSFDKLLQAFNDAQRLYMSHGITTIQDGMIVKEVIPLFEHLVNSCVFTANVVAYVGYEDFEFVKKSRLFTRDYVNNFKLGGIKIFLDGSPQSKTAWVSQPYVDGTFGVSTMKYEDVVKAVTLATDNNLQIIAHCNGDMAIEQFLNAIEEVSRNMPSVLLLRPVCIHSQLMRIDQLERVKSLNVIPSYFVAHTYYWGDVHIENLGLSRASKISPLASTEQLGIPFTLHNDTPVIAPSVLDTVKCAVKRVTKNGVTLGSNEKISVMTAIKSVTSNCAYQYFEESVRGSIKVGNYADFTLLNTLPTYDNIDDIKVIATIKNGETVYNNQFNN